MVSIVANLPITEVEGHYLKTNRRTGKLLTISTKKRSVEASLCPASLSL